MTGIEPAAIAGAVLKTTAKAVDKAVESEAKEAEALLRIAEQSGELDEAALIRAKRAVVKQHVYLKLTQPLGMLFGVPREYFNTQFSDDMAERLADVPEEDVVTPPSHVAGPAMLGLGFSLDQPQLKAMYLNLLAAASDRRVQEAAHPSFADIIRQLNTQEAHQLSAVLKLPSLPIVEIRVTSGVQPKTTGILSGITLPATLQSFTVLARHVLDWRFEGAQVEDPNADVLVDNWIRLGLVTVDYTSSFSDEDAYTWAETTPLMVAARAQHETVDRKVICQQGILTPTGFGRLFERVVIAAEPKALAAGPSGGS